MARLSYKQIREGLPQCDNPEVLYMILREIVNILEDLETRVSELEQEFEGKFRR